MQLILLKILYMKRDYYKSNAVSYDSKWANYTNVTLNKLLDYLPTPLTDKNVLDWGCGTGELIKKMLLQHTALNHITGYDPSEEMLAQASVKIEQLSAALRNKVKLQSHPQFDQKFDLIVSSNVLHYLPSPDKSLLLFKSLLKKDGCLLLLDYTKNGLLAKYFEWAFKLIDSRHQQAYTGQEIRHLVENNGFYTEKEEEFRIAPLWEGYVIRAAAAE